MLQDNIVQMAKGTDTPSDKGQTIQKEERNKYVAFIKANRWNADTTKESQVITTCHINNHLNSEMQKAQCVGQKSKKFEELRETFKMKKELELNTKQIPLIHTRRNFMNFEQPFKYEDVLFKKIDELVDGNSYGELLQLHSEVMKKITDIKAGVKTMTLKIQKLEDSLKAIDVKAYREVFVKTGSLETGDYFGGEIIKGDIKSDARYVTETNTSMAALSKEDFHNALVYIEKQRIESLCTFFKTIPHFKQLGKMSIKGIASCLQKVKFTKGQQVISEYFEPESVNVSEISGDKLIRNEHVVERAERNAEKLQDDFIYFVLNGEFIAQVTMKIPDNGQDPIVHHGKQNKMFLNLQYQHELQKKIRSSSQQSNKAGTEESNGYRYLLCSDKLN